GSSVPNPPPAGADQVATVELIFEIPGIFWTQGPVTMTWSYMLGEYQAVTPLTTAGCTAPVTDARFEVEGPITNPKIEAPSGHSVALSGTVAAGEVWRVDAGKFTSKIGSTSVMQNTTQAA